MDQPIDRDALAARLKALYADQSKHAIYQSLPGFVAEALGVQFEIDESWRGDAVRWKHIVQHARERHWPLDGRWCDFGANTGFFSLSASHEFATTQVCAVEANPNHAAFIAALAQAFGLRGLQVRHQAIVLDTLHELGSLDVLLHLNVLHHAGADFDRQCVAGVAEFPAYAQDYLTRLRRQARYMAFQLGSNLWGDKRRPIVPVDDDLGKLKLFSGWLLAAGWRIEDVAYATRLPAAQGLEASGKSRVVYRSLPAEVVADLPTGLQPDHWRLALQNLRLHEHPGEFYRRPLFMCAAS